MSLSGSRLVQDQATRDAIFALERAVLALQNVAPAVILESRTPPPGFASGGAVGNSATAARSDHQHPWPGGLTALAQPLELDGGVRIGALGRLFASDGMIPHAIVSGTTGSAGYSALTASSADAVSGVSVLAAGQNRVFFNGTSGASKYGIAVLSGTAGSISVQDVVGTNHMDVYTYNAAGALTSGMGFFLAAWW